MLPSGPYRLLSGRQHTLLHFIGLGTCVTSLLCGYRRIFPRGVRHSLPVFQLIVDLIKPLLQRAALQRKRFLLRGRVRKQTCHPAAHSAALHRSASRSALAACSRERISPADRQVYAPAEPSARHGTRAHWPGTISCWHSISPRFVIGICRLRFLVYACYWHMSITISNSCSDLRKRLLLTDGRTISGCLQTIVVRQPRKYTRFVRRSGLCGGVIDSAVHIRFGRLCRPASVRQNQNACVPRAGPILVTDR